MKLRATLLVLLLAALWTGGGACHSPEPVIPFMDAGDPCSGSTAHAIDCAEYAETTCVIAGSTCPRETYGCADAAYFTKSDYSECPPEAGGSDAAQLGDVSLFGDDVSEGPEVGSDASDASGD
jgi:hypothetical protein